MRFRLRAVCQMAAPALAAAAVLVSTQGCRQRQTESMGQHVIAEVNGEKIFYGMLIQELDRSDCGGENLVNPAAIRAEVLVKMIDEILLLQEAMRLDYSLSKEDLASEIEAIRSNYPGTSFDEMLIEKLIDFESWKEEMRRDLLIRKLIDGEITSKVRPGEDELLEYYQAHLADYEVGEQVHARQIVVDSLAEAKEIKKALRGGADFAELARERSIAPEGERGGDLGRVGPGTLPPEFENTLFSLRTKRTSPIVRTQYGYHLFQVVEKIPAHQRPFEEVRLWIEKEIVREREEARYEQWVDELRASARMLIHDGLLEELEAHSNPQGLPLRNPGTQERGYE